MTTPEDVVVASKAMVVISRHRWHVVIVIKRHGADTPTEVYIASADGAVTERDGIWFGTEAEYDRAGAPPAYCRRYCRREAAKDHGSCVK